MEHEYNMQIEKIKDMINRRNAAEEIANEIKKLGGIMKGSMYSIIPLPVDGVEMTGESRLHAESFNAKHIQADGCFGLTSAVFSMKRKVENWLRKNPVGWVNEISLRGPSSVFVELNCCIFSPLALDDDVYSEAKREASAARQERRLHDLNVQFSIEKILSTREMLATEQNFVILESLLRSAFQARHIRFSTDRMLNTEIRVIKSITFWADTETIMTIEEPSQKDAPAMISNNQLTEIGMERAIYILDKMDTNIVPFKSKEIQSADRIRSNLLLFRYSDLCSIFGVETEISRNVAEAEPSQNRACMLAANEIAMNNAQKMSADLVAGGYTSLCGKLRIMLKQDTCLILDDFNVYEDYIEITLKDFGLIDECGQDRYYLAQQYVTRYITSSKNGRIAASTENATFLRKVAEIYGGEVTEIHFELEDGDLTLESVKIRFWSAEKIMGSRKMEE